MKDAIAVVVYIDDGGDLRAKPLFHVTEIDMVRDCTDMDVQEQVNYIIRGKELSKEDHT